MRLFSQDTKVQALKGVPLFEGLSRKELIQLERACEDLQIEPGKVLCKEGQLGHEFFVLVDGKVQVTRKGRRVATLSGGDFLGEIALATELPRTATVTAETPVRLFVLTRREFHTVLDQTRRSSARCCGPWPGGSRRHQATPPWPRGSAHDAALVVESTARSSPCARQWSLMSPAGRR